MSTIDIGIAETPMPVQALAGFAPTALAIPTPLAADDGFFYVGSVKIASTVSPGTATPAQRHGLVAVTT